jgi:hypothetical protein
MPIRGLHLQRPGDLPRIRAGRGRGLPGAGRQDRGGERRLHLRGAQGGVLLEDGRGQHRPQRLHGRLLPQPVLGPARPRARDPGVP